MRMDNLPCDPRLASNYQEPTSQPTTPTMSYEPKRKRRWILTTLGIFFLLLFPVINETYFRCAICSMSRTNWRIMGLAVPLYNWKRPTPTSNWYQENIEPDHQHVWVQTGYMEGKTFYGLKTYMLQSSSLSTGPLVYLPLGHLMQRRIYQKSPDPKQARDIFLRLAHNEPYESDAYEEQKEIWLRLNEWIESGMKEPWPFDDAQKPSEK